MAVSRMTGPGIDTPMSLQPQPRLVVPERVRRAVQAPEEAIPTNSGF